MTDEYDPHAPLPGVSDALGAWSNWTTPATVAAPRAPVALRQSRQSAITETLGGVRKGGLLAGTLMEQYVAPHTYQRRLSTADIDAVLEASHHYLITRAPSVRVVDTWTTSRMAIMRTEWHGERRDIALEFEDAVEPTVTTLSDGRYWILSSREGELLLHGGAGAFASLVEGDGSELSRHRVLYVGKAYGRTKPDGGTTRNAPIRLETHSKYQEIVEDHSSSAEFDVFVTPLLGEEGVWTGVDFIDDTELGPDLFKVLDLVGPNGEETRISLAEQALIAYFKPEHNDVSVKWSGSTKLRLECEARACEYSR